MARKDLVRTTASLDGVPIPGEFRSFSGGELTSADIKTTRGAGGPQQARGGRKTVGNVTVAREDDGTFDLKGASARRGKGRMSVTRTPLDNDGNPLTNRSVTYTGILLAVRYGDGDNESDTDIDEFELEMSCDSEVA